MSIDGKSPRLPGCSACLPGDEIVPLEDEERRAVVVGDHEFELIENDSLARQLQPDIVVMDVRMRDIDGLEATREIRAHSPKASASWS